ncbi:MAG: AAA family ATPase [Desulfobulbaceae bacterium]|nr:AAA family ATPase [Desulfobulbaceae bacterium]
MLPINTYTTQEIKTIQRSCAYLFPPEKVFDLKFLKQINDFLLQQAYLQKVKYCHPEASKTDSEKRKNKKLQYLRKARQSYDFLLERVKLGAFEKTPAPKSKIIAVGGAKGGVGKSMLAANLSVYLAASGYKTVAMDLDLGGANLALYLGEKYIMDRTVNDYLNKKFPSLTDILVQSRIGPMIIGGDSSELGAANIHYARKLKLIKAIRELDADYVVLDLGGDTSYNMLDFFLLGDFGLVMTTKDSASYIGAYQFLKTALYRKLNRISGPEAGDEKITDSLLAQLLKDATQSSGKPVVGSITELLQRVTEHDPLDVPLVLRAIIDFNPYLIVNRITNPVQAQQVMQTITSLAAKTLSVPIANPGSIRKIPEIEDNLRNFTPLVAQNPNGKLAADIGHIVTNLGITPKNDTSCRDRLPLSLEL